MKIKDLVRSEVLALKPYMPAKKVKNKIRLNANESPYTVTDFAASNTLNLYQTRDLMKSEKELPIT